MKYHFLGKIGKKIRMSCDELARRMLKVKFHLEVYWVMPLTPGKFSETEL